MRKDRVQWGAATGDLKSKTEERRMEEYQEKRLQSKIYRGQDERCTSG